MCLLAGLILLRGRPAAGRSEPLLTDAASVNRGGVRYEQGEEQSEEGADKGGWSCDAGQHELRAQYSSPTRLVCLGCTRRATGGSSEERASSKMAAAGVVDITPVEGVTVSVRSGSANNFDVEWRDMRCLPTSSDADVSRNATPRAFIDSTRTVHGLVAILHRIVFGERQDDMGKMVAMGEVAPDTTGPLVIYLQCRRNRAVMRRVELTTDRTGELGPMTVYEGTRTVFDSANASGSRQSPMWAFLQQLSEMCCGDHGFVLVRETCW